MSHVPEMQRFVEWLEAPGWEIHAEGAYGPTSEDRIWFGERIPDRAKALGEVASLLEPLR